jgi:hypothetical protein
VVPDPVPAVLLTGLLLEQSLTVPQTPTSLDFGIAAPGVAPYQSNYSVSVVDGSAHPNSQASGVVIAQRVDSARSGSLSAEQMAALLVSTPTGAGASIALQVRSALVIATGVHVRFNQQFDPRAFAGSGEAPVVLLHNGVPLRGRIVIDPDGLGFIFVAESATLPRGEYSVLLRSGPGGLRKLDGEALDGDHDGQPGGDYKGSFSVIGAAAAAGLAGLAGLALGAMSERPAGNPPRRPVPTGARRHRGGSGADDDALPRINWDADNASTLQTRPQPKQRWVAKWLQSADESVNDWRIWL